MLNLYAQLGVTPIASAQDIESAIAYHQLHHTVPEDILNQAIAQLLEPTVREQYNAQLYVAYPEVLDEVLQQQQQTIATLQKNLSQQQSTRGGFFKSGYGKNLLALATFCLLASLVWAYYSPYQATKQMHAAIQNHQAEVLSEYIDYAAVQNSIRQPIITAIQKEAAALGQLDASTQVLANAMVDKILTEFITPEGMHTLLQQNVTHWHERLSMRQGYDSWNTFHVKLIPKRNPAQHATVVLTREGWGNWRVKALVLPDLYAMDALQGN